MNCKHCNHAIAPSRTPLLPGMPLYYHPYDGMFVCFNEDGHPMHGADENYCVAEPDDGEER